MKRKNDGSAEKSVISITTTVVQIWAQFKYFVVLS